MCGMWMETPMTPRNGRTTCTFLFKSSFADAPAPRVSSPPSVLDCGSPLPLWSDPRTFSFLSAAEKGFRIEIPAGAFQQVTKAPEDWRSPKPGAFGVSPLLFPFGSAQPLGKGLKEFPCDSAIPFNQRSELPESESVANQVCRGRHRG